MAPTLFDPIKLGSVEAKNRVFLAPLTRTRATDSHVPTPLMGEYYAQRSSAGLLISEGTAISPIAVPNPRIPGIWSQEQVDAWKPITKGVHDRGSKIVCQLWHGGRMSHPSLLGGRTPHSASATVPTLPIFTQNGFTPAVQAHEMTVDEIKATVKDYAHAAKNALEAGFDGVQIHSANGYLLDQFLCSSTNLRTDEYGGSPENRVRFYSEVVQAVVAAIGGDKVGTRFSPNGDSQGAVDAEYETTYPLAAKAARDAGSAWIELRETKPENSFWASFTGKKPDDGQVPIHDLMRQAFGGPVVLNEAYTVETAQEAIKTGVADAISWGRYFISNPDLPIRIQQGKEWAPVAPKEAWYNPTANGYTDFPFAA